MQREDYERFTRPHRRFVRQLLLDLEFFIADLGSLSVFSVSSRIKDFNGAIEKSRRMRVPIEDLQDVAGVRVVVATQIEVEIVKSFFCRRQSISKDLEIKKEVAVAKDTGYRSTHLITTFSGHYTRSVYSGHLEIQIPTIFEHAFNFVSHAWVYKSSTIHDEKWNERFRALSGQLAALDSEVTELHRDACDQARFDPEREPLSAPLFCRIAREEFGEEVPLADAVDYVQRYSDLGVQTIGQLQRFFRNRDVQLLWDDFADVESQSGEKLFLSGRKVVFWSMFGTRLEGARELLESLRTKKA